MVNPTTSSAATSATPATASALRPSALYHLALESERLPRMGTIDGSQRAFSVLTSSLTGAQGQTDDLGALPFTEAEADGDNDTRATSHDSTEADQPPRRGPTFTFLNQQTTNTQPVVTTSRSPPVATPQEQTSSQPDPSAGEVPSSSNRQPAAHQRQGGTGGREKRKVATFSMRDMLRPVGPIARDYLPEPERPTADPRRGSPSDDDPVSMGFVSERTAKLLVDFFFVHLNTWSGILDPRFDTHDTIRARSAFLYTAILCVASLHNQNQIQLPIVQGGLGPSPATSQSASADRAFLQPFAHQQISVLALNHATTAFIDGQSSLNVVQAFYLLSTWKSPDDSISYLRIGYAAKLAMDLDLSRKQPQKPEVNDESSDRAERDHWWRSRQRMWLALFVQDRVQGFQYFNAFMLPLNDPLIEDCTMWHRHPSAVPADVFLVASVQCRRIQSHFRDQISLIISSTPSADSDARLMSSQAKSRRLMLQLLIPALQSALKDWYIRWESEIRRVFGVDGENEASHVRASGGDGDDIQRTYQRLDIAFGIMRIWKHSIQLHLCSFALADSLGEKGEEANKQRDPELALLGLMALWPVLEGARGILHEFARLPPDRLRSAPDTMSILPDLAAVCLWNLARISGSETVTRHTDYAESTVSLITSVIKVFRAAIIDRTDVVLLHARFLSSVAARIRRQVVKQNQHAARAGHTREGEASNSVKDASSTLDASAMQGGATEGVPLPANGHLDPRLASTDGESTLSSSALHARSADAVSRLPMSAVGGFPHGADSFAGGSGYTPSFIPTGYDTSQPPRGPLTNASPSFSLPSVPEAAFVDYDFTAMAAAGTATSGGDGGLMDPVNQLQDNPLGVFAFDLDFTRLLNGVMNGTVDMTGGLGTDFNAGMGFGLNSDFDL